MQVYQTYIGIDWSENKHDASFLNEAGALLAHIVIPHTPEGFLQLEKTRKRLGVKAADCIVGLETAHNILIDFLWDQGYLQVYVLPPNIVRSSQGRFRQSGARSDPSDAKLIADILRTDRQSLQPWKPDSLLTRQLRAKVSFLRYLTTAIVRTTNRQRAILLRYYPAAAQVFSSLNTLIAQHFIQAYPTPQAAAGLNFAEFQAFIHKHRYPHRKKLAGVFAKLQQPQPEAAPEVVQAYHREAQSLAALLVEMIGMKNATKRETKRLFAQHPDYEIFASLPGAGEYLEPALLVKFGDDRERFPTPASVQTLAGTCPVTISSGKRKLILFRRSCDREFRHIAQQWARASLKDSVWANAYYARVRPHCDSESHAFRCLANRWLAVLWRMWQDRKPYDEEYHVRQRALRSKPRE